MYLLDTNHCSLILLENQAVIQTIKQIGETNIATSVITAGELIYMAENSKNKQQNLSLINQFIEDIRVYYIDEEIAKVYGQIKAALIKEFGPQQKTKRKTTKITELGFDENDLWIAAITRFHDLTLVTSDSDFTRIQTVINLTLENWRT
ncbi:tRNA(fMet)-specific endonuclease VapC [Planktothrix tepida]|uniref:PIN domain-containing protein n=1 Tax=Planktothrix tepida PCC 9214 TaxID=671072 RepID=A0A1J1LGP9_9CYAN|nr:type II toxin-antitoxin system VapC family toxin [Planktothrix tepida]CAD5918037.1 tRNA(fMet)-specific endonuclease VapC [Planktothrix tepida]CUR30761.1 PIN domain-containing protein [Planktothrix tepida PCC 9214]